MSSTSLWIWLSFNYFAQHFSLDSHQWCPVQGKGSGMWCCLWPGIPEIPQPSCDIEGFRTPPDGVQGLQSFTQQCFRAPCGAKNWTQILNYYLLTICSVISSKSHILVSVHLLNEISFLIYICSFLLWFLLLPSTDFCLCFPSFL